MLKNIRCQINKKEVDILAQNKGISGAQVAQLVGASFHTPKGFRFNYGHIPSWGLDPWSGIIKEATNWSFFLKINKSIPLGEDLKN